MGIRRRRVGGVDVVARPEGIVVGTLGIQNSILGGKSDRLKWGGRERI
jgi:hypothetical protein